MSTINSNAAQRSTFKAAIARLCSRSRLASAGLATIAAVACTAAISAPAQAASTACKAGGVGYSSLPFSAGLSGSLCDTGGINGAGSCPGGPHVTTSIPWWSSPVVHVVRITDGCYHISAYGGAESMWANIVVAVTDPADGLTIDETVWLRIAMNSEGQVHTSAG